MQVQTEKKRIESVDVMRGIVMVIMVLDHVRDMLHTTSITQTPTDLATTTPAVFFTRWITHLCAPTFVFLSGTSAFLSLQNKNDLAASRKFLFTRGFWLVVIEFTLVNFGLWFDVHFSVFLFDVIATIGCGFIVLSLLLKWPVKAIAALGLIILFCHDIVALLPLKGTSVSAQLARMLFLPGAVPIGKRLFVMGYPPIPWLGIMLLGFACGKLFLQDVSEKKKRFLQLGLMGIAIAICFRAVNVYGDLVPWAAQKKPGYTFLSFINLTKYPPSLDFSLFFLGVMFLILSFIEGRRNKLTQILQVYGKVPLFYFVVHWYIIHPIVFIMIFMQGFQSSDMVFGFNFGRPKEGSGLSLPWIYLIWIAVVILLYPLCRWYGQYRKHHPEKKWLRYF